MDDQARGGPRPGDDEAPGLSPVRAFFLVGAIFAAVVAAGFLATRDSSPATEPGPARSPDYSLTDAEAIAEFERLKEMLSAAYHHRDLTLVDQFVAPDAAPGVRRVEDELRTLLADQVLYRTKETREALEVAVNGSARVEFRETVVKQPRFIDERSGKNIASVMEPERQVIVWVIRRYGTEWKIYSSTIVSAEPAGPERRAK